MHPSGDKGIETKEEARRYHRDGIERHFSQHLTDADVKALTRALEKVGAHARPLRPGAHPRLARRSRVMQGSAIGDRRRRSLL